MSEPRSKDDQDDALRYHPAKVSWATAEFVRRPPHWLAMVFPYMLATVFITTFAYSALTEIPVTVKAPGEIKTEQAPLPVLANVSGRIKTLSVTVNQVVERGALLAVFEDQIKPADYKTLKASTDGVLQLLALDEKKRCGRPCSRKFIELSERGFVAEVKPPLFDQLVQVQDLLREYIKAKQQMAAIDFLLRENYRKINEAKRKIETLRKDGAEDLLAATVDQLAREIGDNQAAVADRRNSTELNLLQTRDRLSVRLGGLMKQVNDYRADRTLTAATSGIVTKPTVTAPGQTVQAGQTLLELVPTESKIIAELAVANQDVSELKPKQAVQLKIDALPEREYGAMRGEVIEVAASADQPQSGGSGGPPVYKVRVALEKTSLKKAGRDYPVKVGMTLQGMIVTRKDTLLRLAVVKVLNLKDALVGE